jgi:putative phage-type endonuclease
MICLNIEQQSEAWFEARAGRITGTRFKQLCAGESTDTYKGLVTKIACEIITHKIEETYQSADMANGIETEPDARKAYEFLFDVQVKEVGFIMTDEDHKYHDWVGISPDGVVEPGMIEIKCPKMTTHLEYIEANKLPAEYRHQVQGQLYVTGLEWCDFMSYVEGMKPFVFRVHPDLELHAEFERRLDKLIIDVKNKLEIYKNYDYND